MKLNDYKNNLEKWKKLGFEPGDTIYKVGLLRELSLSQITYQTLEQHKAIEREAARNKRRYGQTYEGYFINKDGTLNFNEMIKTLDEIISSGAMSINKVLDKHINRTRNEQLMIHPETVAYRRIKEDIFNTKLASLDDTDNDNDSNQLVVNEDNQAFIIDEDSQEEINLMTMGVTFEGDIEDDIF